jgi:hypothetical protein
MYKVFGVKLGAKILLIENVLALVNELAEAFLVKFNKLLEIIVKSYEFPPEERIAEETLN